jgi:predicted Zn-dependent peptidase
MQKAVLDNGLKVIYDKKASKIVVVQVMINVGSNCETPRERGISHFLEHILFEGTAKRPTNQLISNEIEKIGGEFNAYTSNERTSFYVIVLKKHFTKAIDILADILQNSLFKEEHIKREKKIVLKEIDMIYDESSYYQWIMLQKNLFKKHPAKYPAYGDRRVIKNLTREKIINFYEKFYSLNNMTISVIGNVPNWREEIARKFSSPKRKLQKISVIKEPKKTKNVIKKEKRKIVNTYSIVAFPTVPRNHPDSYVLDVINGILGRGQSGKMFTEVRSKRGLAYEVGTQNINDVSFGYFAVYATINRKNVKLTKKIIMEELQKLKEITPEELQEAKDYVEGNYYLDLEDSQKVADQLLFWEQVEDAELLNSFVEKIKAVTISDVQKVVDKYFQYHTQVVLEGK